MILYSIILIFSVVTTSCEKDDPIPSDESPVYREYESVKSFEKTWDSLSAIPDTLARKALMQSFWDSLTAKNQIPFAIHDTVLFMYKGKSEPSWAGDFNGWGAESTGWKGKRLGNSDYWWLKKQLPPDARLDYKVVVGNNWILDPANPKVQYSGWGPNSQLTMPYWVFPEETMLHEGVSSGSLSANLTIRSAEKNLGYNVNYKVYLPYNYSSAHDLPVIYVTDGHEYADSRLGAMTIVLDNLIFQGIINPVIAVFIDPRDPITGENRRMDEYRASIRFANFLADELTAAIDSNYNTMDDPEKRAILGTSLGGWNAAWVGLQRHDKFRLIGIHSPAFDNAILHSYEQSEKLPLKIFMSTGTIYDTQLKASQMRDIMRSKEYELSYVEVSDGHSWGNWRALMDTPLIWFFGKNE